MTPPPKRDWFKIWVHFFFGAIFGSVLGLKAWGRSTYASSPSMWTGVAFIGGGALLVGLIAGVMAESGWDER